MVRIVPPVRRRLAAVAAASLLAGGCASDPSGSTVPSSPAPHSLVAPLGAGAATDATGAPPDTRSDDPARCTAAELAGSLGPAQGAAGSVEQTLALTNVGNRTCSLRGFPGVSYVAEGGRQVGPAAVRSGPRGGAVRLGVGGSAVAALRLVNVRNYDPAVCRPTPVLGLRVYPPGDTGALFVARVGTGCAGTPPGQQLEVRSLRAR